MVRPGPNFAALVFHGVALLEFIHSPELRDSGYILSLTAIVLILIELFTVVLVQPAANCLLHTAGGLAYFSQTLLPSDAAVSIWTFSLFSALPFVILLAVAVWGRR